MIIKGELLTKLLLFIGGGGGKIRKLNLGNGNERRSNISLW